MQYILYIYWHLREKKEKKHYSSDNSKKHEEESQAFKESI